jgi:hypothetical protein
MNRLVVSILIIFLLGACKEKYISPANTPVTGYLVVEGVINSGNGTTKIILKRTTQLDSNDVVFEKGANVYVEGENNTKFSLIESGAGNYSVQGLNLNNSIKYRLHINTKDGKVYQSDYVIVQSTPPIDSVSWKQDSLGVHLFVNAHDPTNNTKYYQWDFNETWEFHSAFLKYYKYIPIFTSNGLRYGFTNIDSIRGYFDSTVIKCWHEEFSTNIIIGSTISLSENKIYLPIHFIPTGSVKMSVLYSINTRQYSLSEGKYQYLQRMKKNTESTGTIFDAQPSELKGNIHCISNPGDPVIGYMDICQIHESRIFINNDQLPNWDYRAPCMRFEFTSDLDQSTLAHSLGYEPIYKGKEPVIGPPPFGSPGTFFYSTPECLDCTLTGTNVKPSYWR